MDIRGQNKRLNQKHTYLGKNDRGFMESPILVNDKKTITGWALFDWANSSYALVITAAIFPSYYASITSEDVIFLGMELKSSALYSFAITAAYLFIALLGPILSGIADYGGRKMVFLKFFTTIGSLACISLWFFESELQLEIGILAFIIATIGFTGGQIFYNSYLPVIATEDQYDRISAKGFSFGYIGSVLLLISNLIIILNHEALGLELGTATRIAFIMVGLWWIGFAQIPFKRLPKDKKNADMSGFAQKGIQEIKSVWKRLKTLVQTRRFLMAFFLYNAAAQTVIFLAALFAEEEMKFETTELIILILILQLVGIVGAILFSKISKIKGNKFSLSIILVIWVLVCICAYFVTTPIGFYSTAAGVGLVMGGVQSLSRSTYSKLLPKNTEDTASWFSFYELTDKIGVVCGTLGFGVINELTGSMRYSILLLAVFFIFGFFVLRTVTIQTEEEILQSAKS